jgi:hypothetical protein
MSLTVIQVSSCIKVDSIELTERGDPYFLFGAVVPGNFTGDEVE